MSDEDKNKRVSKIKDSARKNSKYGVDLIKKIKQKINEGVKVKQLKELYPQVSENYFYSLQFLNYLSHFFPPYFPHF